MSAIPQSHVDTLAALVRHLTREQSIDWLPNQLLFAEPNPNDPETALLVAWVRPIDPFPIAGTPGWAVYEVFVLDDDDNDKCISRIALPPIT